MNEHIVINKDRSVVVPISEKKIGIQYDHNVNKITFDCPRYADDNEAIDMSRMHVFLNYMLPDKTTGCTILENVVVDETDPAIIHFDWVVTRNHTRVKGVMSTLICIKQTDTEGTELYHWNTDLFQQFIVGDGMECGKIVVDENPDVITQLLVRMDAVDARTSTEAIQGYVNNYLTEHPVSPTEEQMKQGVAANSEMFQSSVDDYLGRNPLQLDNGLTETTKAAPANKVGEIQSDVTDLKGDLDNLENDLRNQFERLNLFNKDSKTIVNGYFIQQNGTKTANDTWCYDVIDVKPNTTLYIYPSIDDNSKCRTFICFFDASGNVVEGGNQGYNRAISVPNTATKMAVSTPIDYKEYLNIGYSSVRLFMGHNYNTVLKTDNVLDRYIVEVGQGKRFTSVYNAFKHACLLDYAVTINIYDGEYDLFNEMGGVNFLSSASTSAIWSELNPVFTNDVIINGIGNVTLKMEIDDDIYSQYQTIASKLSIINNKGNIEVNNIDMVGKNIRYSIHDECDNVNSYDGTKHIYRNCHIENESCLACVGIGYSTSEYLFDNCYIKMSSNNNVFYSHTWDINKGGSINIIDSVIDSTRETGFILQVLSNIIFNVNLVNSYLKKAIISSGDNTNYPTNIFRVIGRNCNLTEIQIAESITTSTYEPIFYNW